MLNPGNAADSFNNQRDALNRGDPLNDARDSAGLFTVGPQSNTLWNIHFEVGPQLRSIGLTLCSVEKGVPPASKADVDISGCVAQVAPVVLPDVMTYDVSAPAGWPNGRGYDDPVVDRLLAAALLKISGARRAAHHQRALRRHQSAARRIGHRPAARVPAPKGPRALRRSALAPGLVLGAALAFAAGCDSGKAVAPPAPPPAAATPRPNDYEREKRNLDEAIERGRSLPLPAPRTACCRSRSCPSTWSARASRATTRFRAGP